MMMFRRDSIKESEHAEVQVRMRQSWAATAIDWPFAETRAVAKGWWRDEGMDGEEFSYQIPPRIDTRGIKAKKKNTKTR